MSTNALNVIPAAPAKLAVISRWPLRIGVKQAFGLTVAVEDRFGNLESTYSGDVTLSLATGPGANSLSGPLELAVQDGVASFAKLKLNRIGLGYSIRVAGQGSIASTRTTLFAVVPDTQAAARVHAAVVKTKPNVKFHRHGGVRPAVHA